MFNRKVDGTCSPVLDSVGRCTPPPLLIQGTIIAMLVARERLSRAATMVERWQ
jgi:hypothetical protein